MVAAAATVAATAAATATATATAVFAVAIIPRMTIPGNITILCARCIVFTEVGWFALSNISVFRSDGPIAIILTPCGIRCHTTVTVWSYGSHYIRLCLVHVLHYFWCTTVKKGYKFVHVVLHSLCYHNDCAGCESMRGFYNAAASGTD